MKVSSPNMLNDKIILHSVYTHFIIFSSYLRMWKYNRLQQSQLSANNNTEKEDSLWMSL